MVSEDTIRWVMRTVLVALAVWIWNAEKRMTKLELRASYFHGPPTQAEEKEEASVR